MRSDNFLVVRSTWDAAPAPPQPFRSYADGDRPDLLVVWSPLEMARMLAEQPVALPILTAGFSDRAADLTVDASPEALDIAMTRLEPLAQRYRALPAALAAAPSGEDGLLAYLAVREGSLEPVEWPGETAVLDYAARARFPDIEALADRLVDAGLLERRLHERINLCAACGSARLLVREACPACGSPDVADRRVLHHFICAHQAPEDEFVATGNELLCPKCRKPLGHPSVDYEVSTAISVCGACGEATGEPEIGYRCLDCRHTGHGGELASRVVHAYSLTAAGRARAGQTDREAPADGAAPAAAG